MYDAQEGMNYLTVKNVPLAHVVSVNACVFTALDALGLSPLITWTHMQVMSK
jgi:hypothetical protein